jgi:ketosteroid isomerase-like protein
MSLLNDSQRPFKKMKHLLHALFGFILTSGIGFAQVTPPEDPAHEELRTLRKELVAAIIAGDVETQLVHTRPDVVVTWQNQVVCRGHEELREFMKESGSSAFKGYKVEPTADLLTILHGGDTGISTGRSVGAYQLIGKEFEFENRWTATLVKEDGRWLVAAYHVSLNALDNPILNSAKGMLIGAAGVAGVIGLLIGWLLGKKKRS